MELQEYVARKIDPDAFADGAPASDREWAMSAALRAMSACEDVMRVLWEMEYAMKETGGKGDA